MGGGLLRLHSTYRHDLKIYSSDEGRVQTSAAAFTKGLLDLEGTSLTPILVSLVKKVLAAGGARTCRAWGHVPSALWVAGRGGGARTVPRPCGRTLQHRLMSTVSYRIVP